MIFQTSVCILKNKSKKSCGMCECSYDATGKYATANDRKVAVMNLYIAFAEQAAGTAFVVSVTP